MSSIDRRIVDLKMNNGKFNTNIASSVKYLSSLEKALDLRGATQNLQNLQNAGNKFSLAKIGEGVETITKRFSTLGIIGIGVLEEIGRTAFRVGSNIAKSFTVEPVMSGFKEYETQINAIQTILANTESKGTTLNDVTAALDELNHYADMTIYNFTEMTRNIGTFTAAGIDLETSTKAIKGIANLAAVSGSNSQQASTAMYQLSQALAAGSVKLQDWNSVVNAGMGGEIFREALIETARVHGIAVDEMIAKHGSFRESLREGWITSEVLTDTLAKFTGDLTREQLISMGYTEEQTKKILQLGVTANDAATKVKTFTQLMDTLKEAAQSGWTKTWEILIGDFTEAKNLLTQISDKFSGIINASADARNALLQDWKDLGGRDSAINAVKNIFQGIVDFIRPIKAAFRDIFPRTTADKLFNITKAIESFTEKIKISRTTVLNLQRTFRGVFAIFDIGIEALKSIGKGFINLVSYISPATGSLLQFTGDIGEFIVKIRNAIKEGELFDKAIDGIGKVLTPVGDVIKNVIGWLKDFKDELKKFDLSGMKDSVVDVTRRFSLLEKVTSSIKTGFQKIFDFAGVVADKVSDAGSVILGAIGTLAEGISQAIKDGALTKMLDIFSIGVFANLLNGARKFFSEGLGSIFESGEEVLGNIRDVVDGVRDSFVAFQNNLNAKTLLTIAAAIAILTGALFVMSTLDAKELTIGLTGVASLLAGLMGSLDKFQNVVTGIKVDKVAVVSVSMIALATAVVIFAAAVKKLSDLSWEELLVGLVGLATIMSILGKSIGPIASNGKGLTRTSIGLVIFAGALHILVSAVKRIGEIDTDKLAKGLIGVGVLCTELALFLKVADFDKLGVLKGVGLMALAGSLVILSAAVEKFSTLEWDQLNKGLSSVGIVLAELALFTNLTGNAKHMITTATGLAIVAASMHIFHSAIEKFGKMKWEEIGKGLAAIAGSLASVAISMRLMPKNPLSTAIGMIGIAEAIKILTGSILATGGMTWEQIGASLTVLAGSLGIIAIAMLGLNKALPGAAALLTISAALRVFVPVIQTLSQMSLGEIGTALLALAGVFVVVGTAAVVLKPLAPTLIMISVALGILGAAIFAIGAGVAVFAAGMATLAGAGAGAVAVIIEAAKGLIGLIPYFLTEVGNGIISFSEVIAKGAPAIAAAIVAVIVAIVKSIEETAPTIVRSVLNTLLELLTAMRDYLPQIFEVGVDLILKLMDGIEEHIGEITEKGIDICLKFIQAVEGKLPDIIDEGFNLIISFINGIANGIDENIDELMDAALNLAEAVIRGLVTGLGKGLTRIKDAVGDLARKGLDKFKSVLGIASPSKVFAEMGEFCTEGYALGIDKKSYKAELACENMADGCLSVMLDKDYDFENVGKKDINALVEGINSKVPNVKSASENISDIAIEGLTDEQGFKTAGMDSIAAYSAGIVSETSKVLEDTKSFRSEMEEILNTPYDIAVQKGYINNSNWYNWNASDAQNSVANKPITDTAVLDEILRSMGALVNDENRRIFQTGGYEALKKKLDEDAQNRYDTIYDDVMDDIENYKPSIKDEGLIQDGQNILIKPDIDKPASGYFDDGEDIGEAIDKGISSGVEDHVSDALDSVSQVVDSITDIFDNLLGIHSPSKVFFEKGIYILQGLANGLKKAGDILTKPVESIGETIEDHFSATLKPIVDLSNLKKPIKAPYLEFSPDAFRALQSIRNPKEPDNKQEPETKTINQSFVQNNYSPKELSRLDIYRQTRNQIRTAKEALKNA